MEQDHFLDLHAEESTRYVVAELVSDDTRKNEESERVAEYRQQRIYDA
ncbi:hypothetical protein OB920_18170 [Halobacteria archaeon HArc-gm2]|nr:hypothetical protein [Halobacteria archaeon HArc-gm2]